VQSVRPPRRQGEWGWVQPLVPERVLQMMKSNKSSKERRGKGFKVTTTRTLPKVVEASDPPCMGSGGGSCMHGGHSVGKRINQVIWAVKGLYRTQSGCCGEEETLIEGADFSEKAAVNKEHCGK